MRYHVGMDTEFRAGYGRDWLDFAVTLLGRYTDERHDLIDTPAGLLAWLKAWHLTPAASVTEDDVTRARALREALHGIARAAASDRAAATDDVRTVDEALVDDAPVRLRRHAGGLAMSRPGSAREALARLARQAVDDLTGPHPVRLRACGDDECSGIFVDPTGRRRWCSDERCGVKARVRAHRARARASTGQVARRP
jgi:predicted RNA-binding Zn ribbon-like protein